jgi:hypothetical protein
MRFLLALAVAVSFLLAFAVACGDDDEEAKVIPSPATESDGDTADWQAGEEAEDGEDGGDPPPLDAGDSDDDGFDDVVEEDHGSGPYDDASVPETEDGNPGSCSDGMDNDLDGSADDADDGCFLLSVTLDVTPSDYAGPCPVELTFSGAITLEVGSGTVLYQLVRSHYPPGPIRTLTFDSPDTETVGASLGLAISQSGWAAISILAPEEFESDRAEYTVNCCLDSDGDGHCDDDDDDDDNDGFSDADENVYGSDPLDDASVPENDDINLGSCVDSEDNDGDGLLDGADPGCP